MTAAFSPTWLVVCVLTMAGTTYLIRALPLVLFRSRLQGRFLRSFLFYVPYAVLAAMTFPAILSSTQSPLSAAAGLAGACVLAFREKSLLTVAGAACVGVFLAERVLMEPRCAPFLPIMAFSVPFAALHACINGYYYGSQKSRIPAFSQVAEQVIRMGAVFLMASIWVEEGRPITVSLAVYGHLIGEMASAGFTLICLGFFPPDSTAQKKDRLSFPKTAAPLMALALPLMGNRLLLNLLGSAEAIWIPNKLEAFGLTNSEALSIYGVFTSMALPFVLFPSAITNSMAVLLLPCAAQARAQQNERRIGAMVSMSLRYSCYMGILCIGLFTLFGGQLGESVFHDPDAGFFIAALSWLCPFMYLASTMGSILNGLGRTSATFLLNVAAMVIRLAFVVFAIPSFGILGYLWGMLASELVLAFLCCLLVRRLAAFSWDGVNMLIKPSLLLILSIGLYLAIPERIRLSPAMPDFLTAVFGMGVISLCYGGLLLLFHQRRPPADTL